MRFTIGARLGLGFLVMLLLVLAAGSASIITVRRLADLTAIMAQASDEVLRLREIWVSVVETDVALEKAVAAGTEGEIATVRFWQSRLQDEVTAYLGSKKAGSGEAEILQKLETAQQNFNKMVESYANLAPSLPDRQMFLKQRDEIVIDPYLSTLSILDTMARTRMAEALEEIQRAQSSLFLVMVGVTVSAALIGAGLAVWITRSVTRPVRRLIEVADHISMGDLDMSVGVTSRDEIGELQESIERMRFSLKAAMERLKRS